jgi:hypothetical protein
MVAAIALSGCSKVCEPKPLEGAWKENAGIVPAEAIACGGSDTTLKLGFEGKSGPHAFKILTEHLEGKGWKEIRYGGSSMDSLYEKDGKKLSFKVRDAKTPIVDLEMPGR